MLTIGTRWSTPCFICAGDGREARGLLLSFDWLLARARVGPVKAVVADGVMVKQMGGKEDRAVELVESMPRNAQRALVKGGWTHLATACG